MDKGAIISRCGAYRYTLWRRWDESLPFLIFIMLNPSTADHEQDDPTARKGMGFARRLGFGGKHDCAIHATKFYKGRWWEPNEDYPQSEPTHWMPLPAAPAAGATPTEKKQKP